MGVISCLPRELVEPLWWITDYNYVGELTDIMWAHCVMGKFACGRIHLNSYKYTFRKIHHITAIRSNTPIRHCGIVSLWAIPICDLWSVVCSLSHHLSKRNGFPGWRHRPTRPTLLVTRPWTTVARIFQILNIHRKSRKYRTTIIFPPMWSEQKGLFWGLRKKKKLGVRGTVCSVYRCTESKSM